MLDMLLGDVLFALWSSFKQLKARGPGVLQLPLASLPLALEILDEIHVVIAGGAIRG